MDGTLKLWDAGSGQEIFTLNGYTGPVSDVAFSRDGRRLASASGDGTVKLWDTETWQETLTLNGSTRGVRTLTFSQDGKRLVLAGQDVYVDREWEVKVWDARLLDTEPAKPRPTLH